ncbi:hypothetical protein P5G62_005830 [Neobacillus sp. 179-C4.2 HS]|uniref:Uncharacterized protein n=1 Tax=Neobacillus driksii TaxID=3035913 RepID=A0ABV4YPZ2_9BACI|nr:hypothetical protein [Neobacillus sp. 179.-C4.2 HS]MDP5197127.1 hypothetical protein [Neobacillus sp. 179.-C4.2 HS]
MEKHGLNYLLNMYGRVPLMAAGSMVTADVVESVLDKGLSLNKYQEAEL